MVFRRKISAEVRAYARLLRYEMHLKVRDVAKKCNIAPSSVIRITESSLPKVSKRCAPRGKGVPGRPRLLSERAERYLERELLKLRDEVGSFHMSDLMERTRIPHKFASERIVRRCVARLGYHNYNSRRKGVLSPEDLKDRLSFAKEATDKYPANFWTDDVAFYLDGVNFVYKTKPRSHASTPGSKVWRKKSEGLKRTCTSKGRKEGTGGTYVKLIVAISYNKGIIVCHPYEHMTGEFFAGFIRQYFPDMFEDCAKDSMTWVQDGDRAQNSTKAKQAMKDVGAHLLNIPPRSPDINPIENIFHLTQKKLKKEAVQRRIERETLPQFEKRIIEILYSIPLETINNTISSMDKRLKAIIKNKGCRTKY